MGYSIFLARVFSIYFLVMGLVILFRRQYFQEVFVELFKNKVTVFIISFITLVIGILLVVSHYRFTADWRSVITVLAWLAFIKGLLYMFFQEKLLGTKRKLLTHTATLYIAVVIILALAAYLGYHGFFFKGWW